MKIFNFFWRKNQIEDTENNQEQMDESNQTSLVIKNAQESLREVETVILDMNDLQLFSKLLSFVAYYTFMIDFYTDHIENIISVKELLLLKYIDMIKDILKNFHEESATEGQKEKLSETLSTMNNKLYSTIKDINEKKELNLNVDLKTIQDLIRSDF